MIQESRIDIYDYLYGLFYDVVTKNVYSLGEPIETTQSDTEDGFIVIHVGNLYDNSEFPCEAYAWTRCSVTAYVPKKSRGRLDKTRYRFFETAINDVIKNEIAMNSDNTYYIIPSSVLSMDDDEITQKGNQYHLFVKSFIVGIDNNEIITINNS